MVHKISFIVVLYDCDIKKSPTLISLSEKLLNKIDYHLIICNNGPGTLPTFSKDISTLNLSGSWDFIEYIDNKPLSLLYNDFLVSHDSEKYVFLDHDTIVTNSFIQLVYKESYELGIPKIVNATNEKVYYPFSDKKVFTGDGILNSNNCYSIGSGIIIKRSLVDLIQKKFGDIFDSNYALYGVDVSLFKRINLLSKKGCSIIVECSGALHHSLSRVDQSDNSFRRKERALDYGITAKRYPSARRYMGLIREIITKSLSLKWKVLFYTLLGFTLGYHPRVKEWLSKNKYRGT